MTAASRSGKRPITAEDLFEIQLVGDPQLSPDKTRIAYVLTRLDKAADTYTSAIWLVPVTGGTPRPLTNGLHRDQSPRWSPNGQDIAFVSNRPGRRPKANGGAGEATDNETKKKPDAHIWVIPVHGGEARQVTAVSRGASDPVWSPDGNSLAFIAKTRPEDDPEAPPKSAAIADERVVNSIQYRADGSGFIDAYPHVWTVAASGDNARQLTTGPYGDSHPTWSLDGQQVYFVANRTAEHEINNQSLLYRVAATGGNPESVIEGAYRLDAPVWSPAGDKIALLGTDDPIASSSKNANLWIFDVKTARLVNHSADWDRSLGDFGMSDVSGPGESLPVWSEDGRGVFSLASDSGATHVYRIDLETKTVEKRTEGERRIAGFQVLDGERFVVLSGDASYPFELALVDAAQECQLTTHNADFLAEVELAPAMEFRSHNPVDGKEIQGWVLHPPGFDEAKETKYPLVVQIHGGPHAMYGQAMFHEMQLMAAHGYVVLFTNPRGSSGYGEEFTSCTRGTWGESDMPDVMAALDTLVAKGYVDEQRMGVTGGSYGGYLTNWIIGHTDRFRAAATQRCVSDVVSFYGTSDIGFTFGEYEFDGTPWDQYERLRHHSPITYVESMKTPLLIIHSEQDLRCPIEQGEQLFIALKRLGRETTFVRIPDESHNLSRNGTPSRRLARLHHLLTWFDQQL